MFELYKNIFWQWSKLTLEIYCLHCPGTCQTRVKLWWRVCYGHNWRGAVITGSSCEYLQIFVGNVWMYKNIFWQWSKLTLEIYCLNCPRTCQTRVKLWWRVCYGHNWRGAGGHNRSAVNHISGQNILNTVCLGICLTLAAVCSWYNRCIRYYAIHA